jgi:hypothetical protein
MFKSLLTNYPNTVSFIPLSCHLSHVSALLPILRVRVPMQTAVNGRPHSSSAKESHTVMRMSQKDIFLCDRYLRVSPLDRIPIRCQDEIIDH